MTLHKYDGEDNENVKNKQTKNVNVIYLPTKHQRALGTRVRGVRAFQVELEFGNVGFYGKGKPEYTEKNPQSRDENQQQTLARASKL